MLAVLQQAAVKPDAGVDQKDTVADLAHLDRMLNGVQQIRRRDGQIFGEAKIAAEEVERALR